MHRSNRMVFLRRFAAMIFLGQVLSGTRAGVITGQISGTSVFVPYTTTTGTGTVASNLVTARSLSFGTVTAGIGNTGTFTNIHSGSTITIQSPFQVNPLVATGGALWTVSNYSFVATSLTTLYDATNFLLVSGTGILKDGTNADISPGIFSATFSQSVGAPYTYSWNFETYLAVPTLTFNTYPGGGSALLYTTNSTNFILQFTPIMSKFPTWSTLTNIPVIVGANYVVSNLVTRTNQRFFRLIH